MGIVADFLTKVVPQALTATGTETIAVGGGTAVACVLSEVRHQREFMDVGFAQQTALDAVVRRSVWDAAYTSTASSYVGKSAVARTLTFRVEAVEVGAYFVTVRLAEIQKA